LLSVRNVPRETGENFLNPLQRDLPIKGRTSGIGVSATFAFWGILEFLTLRLLLVTDYEGNSEFLNVFL
jgi:hypothetical protein